MVKNLSIPRESFDSRGSVVVGGGKWWTRVMKKLGEDGEVGAKIRYRYHSQHQAGAEGGDPRELGEHVV